MYQFGDLIMDMLEVVLVVSAAAAAVRLPPAKHESLLQLGLADTLHFVVAALLSLSSSSHGQKQICSHDEL